MHIGSCQSTGAGLAEDCLSKPRHRLPIRSVGRHSPSLLSLVQPARLAEKLKKIRENLGLSQSEMLRLLELDRKVYYTAISGYELGTREPPLPVLLNYARIARLCVDDLIDDKINLPRRIPSAPKHRKN